MQCGVANEVKMALRTTGHLLLGVVRIYSRKTKYLLADCNEAFLKIKMAFRPGQIETIDDGKEAPVNAISLPEVYTDFDSSLPDFSEVDFANHLQVNQSRIDDITLKEDQICDQHMFGAEFGSDDFGDGGFGPVTFGMEDDFSDFPPLASVEDGSGLEVQRDASSFSAAMTHRNVRETTPNLDGAKAPGVNIFNGDDFGGMDGEGGDDDIERNGLPVSAESGLTHDILVSRTSVRPKACNQVTGRCKGGGLESSPTNKLHMSTPGKRNTLSKLIELEDSVCTYNARTLASEAAIEDLMMQAKKIKYDVIGLTETRRRHPLNAVYETGEELFLGTCDSRVVGGVDVLVNTSSIFHDVVQSEGGSLDTHDDLQLGAAANNLGGVGDAQESFTLEPLEAGALDRQQERRRRRRRLIIDDQKNISGDEMKANMADYSDTLQSLDLAPPTRRLMRMKESGTVEKLFHLPGCVFMKAKPLVRLYQSHLVMRARVEEDILKADEIRREMDMSETIDDDISYNIVSWKSSHSHNYCTVRRYWDKKAIQRYAFLPKTDWNLQ
ncbi:Rad21 / Rec8 like protein, partial [Necator americanus]